MPTAWYALRTKPHKEQLVWHQVQVLGFEVFYPKLRANPANPRARRSKPYFPGYVFVSVDLEASGINAFQYMPHAIGMVRFDGEPGVIPEAAIVSLRRHITHLNSSEGVSAMQFQRGDNVRIYEGPLEGYRAIFDHRLPGKQRVKVLLELMGGRSLPVELSSFNIILEEKKIVA